MGKISILELPVMSLDQDLIRMRAQTAKWIAKNTQDTFKDKTLSFINMIKKSGQRDCDCENAYPKEIIKEVEQDGKIKKLSHFACSKCGGQFYKYPDFSFLLLYMGMKRSGKTTGSMSVTDLVYRSDPYRKIALFQCPDALIYELHNMNWCKKYETVCERAQGEMKWSKVTPPHTIIPNGVKIIETYDEKREITSKLPEYQYNELKFRVCDCKERELTKKCNGCKFYQKGFKQYRKISSLKEVEFNDIVVMDEAIISANAKEGLKLEMRDMDKFLVVLAHRRVVMISLFQRYEIVKSLKELADIIVYKKLSTKTIEANKDDKYLKRNADRISKLDKNESVFLSDLHFFDTEGIIYNKVPEFYTNRISMSYSAETDFIGGKGERRRQREIALEMAQWLIDNDILVNNKSDKEYARWELRQNFDEYIRRESIFKLVFEAYQYLLREMEMENHENGEEQEENQEDFVDETENYSSFADKNVSKQDIQIYVEWFNGRNVTKFTEEDGFPFHVDKQRVVEITRRVGKYYFNLVKKDNNRLQGESVERFVKRRTYEEGGWGILGSGSGGWRGIVPSVDMIDITQDGWLKPVQIKMKEGEVNSFSPMTFNSELVVANKLYEISKNTVVACPHCLLPIKRKHLGNYGLLKVDDKAWLYMMKKTNQYFKSKKIVKKPILVDYNKKTVKIIWKDDDKEPKLLINEPNFDAIKDEKLINFLKSNNKLWLKSEEEEEIN